MKKKYVGARVHVSAQGTAAGKRKKTGKAKWKEREINEQNKERLRN